MNFMARTTMCYLNEGVQGEDITNSFQVYFIKSHKIQILLLSPSFLPSLLSPSLPAPPHYVIYRTIVKTSYFHGVALTTKYCSNRLSVNRSNTHSSQRNFTCPIKSKAISGSGLCSVQLYPFINPTATGLLLSRGQKTEAALGKRAAWEIVVKAPSGPTLPYVLVLRLSLRFSISMLNTSGRTFLLTGVLIVEATSGTEFHFPLRLFYCLQFKH